MTLLKTLAFTLVAGSALVSGAFAMEPMMMKDGQAMVVMPDGQSMMMDSDMKMMEMAMKNATPVTEGMIFYMQDGKMMMTKDMKMEDGKMMSESMMMMNK